MVGADIFFIKNKTLMSIVHYYCNFPIVKRADSVTGDDLINAVKIVFADFRFPKNTISDTDMNFTSKTFRQFCKLINLEQTITSSHHHWRNGQVEACIKVVKYTIKNALIVIMMSI